MSDPTDDISDIINDEHGDKLSRIAAVLGFPEPAAELTAAPSSNQVLRNPLTTEFDTWVLVPAEPTEAMTKAAASTPGMRAIDDAARVHQLRGNKIDASSWNGRSPLQQAWDAMLGAAPQAPAAPAGQADARDAKRYRWLRDAPHLLLRSSCATWSRPDGTKFRDTHFLCAYDTQYAPQPSLDAAIDAAMSPQPDAGLALVGVGSEPVGAVAQAQEMKP